jgi:hypothetical protein
MALKDHFVEEATSDSGSLTGEDSWTFQHINVSRAWRILEAFDNDLSGFVTVKEVNEFTRSKPSNWRCVVSPWMERFIRSPVCSLPHWIVYWAIGKFI